MNLLRSLALLLAGATACHAAFIDIDADTVIDSSSPLSGEKIRVIDGVGGPTHVDLVDDGLVFGFNLEENSSLTIDGGESTYFSWLRGDSRLHLKSGRIACSDDLCRTAGDSPILRAYDRSEFVLSGGRVDGRIQLRDESTLTIVGQNLSLIEFRGTWFVRGELADGTVLDDGLDNNLSVDVFRGTADGRIFLVPESTSAALVILILGSLATKASFRKRA